ncbi:MAG: YlbF family regulator [Halanaerobium sp.]
MTSTTNMAEEFADKLKKTDSFQNLNQAVKTLNNDQQALDLLKEFRDVQSRCQQKQANGNLEHSDLQQLRELRTALGKNEVLNDFYQSNDQAAVVCKNSFTELSEQLELNLEQYIGSSGGCC